MVKKLVHLTLATVFLLSFGVCYAEMTDADYHSQIAGLHKEIRDAYQDYVKKTSDARKGALGDLEKLGHTKADIEARKAVHEKCKKEEADLLAAYKEKKMAILQHEKDLRLAQKEANQTMETTQTGGKTQ